MKTRAEIPADGPAIRAIHLLAHNRTQEADLVDKVRDNAAAKLSMVMEHDGAIVAHVLFSPVLLGEGAAAVRGLGLAPVGVLPHLQKQGIGTMLIRAALAQAKAGNCPFVAVLGDPAYYARFGFEPARDLGVHCKWDASASAFMLLVFDKTRVIQGMGLARYGEEFDALT
jgi:putative acetyltransferase